MLFSALLFSIRERKEDTDRCFEPLRQTLGLLRRYEAAFHRSNESLLDLIALLEKIPADWTTLKRKASSTRDKLSAMQLGEAEKVRSQIIAFQTKVHRSM